MKAKLAMFDLDGTLFDTRSLNYLAYKAALEKFNFKLDKEYFYSECNGRHYKVFLPQILNNDITYMEDIHRLKKEFYEKFLGEAIKNEHLFNIIKLMREEYYLAVVTTASRKNCEEILSKFDALSLFDLVIAGEDVSKKKPEPEGYLKAMKYFDISPENSIIFEDSEVGILAGERSGAKVFVVKGYS